MVATAEDVNTTATTDADYDVLSTPELVTPPAQPDAHRGVIIGVSTVEFESGTTGVKVSLQSQDAGFETDVTIFPPKEFVADITLDPTELSDEVPEGKKQSPKTRYASVVANSTKDAEFQRLKAIGKEAGRSLEGMPRPTNFEEYVGLFNALLSGVEVVFTRQPDVKAEDPAFRNRLKVSRIYDASIINKPKALAKYKKAWLTE